MTPSIAKGKRTTGLFKSSYVSQERRWTGLREVDAATITLLANKRLPPYVRRTSCLGYLFLSLPRQVSGLEACLATIDSVYISFSLYILIRGYHWFEICIPLLICVSFRKSFCSFCFLPFFKRCSEFQHDQLDIQLTQKIFWTHGLIILETD